MRKIHKSKSYLRLFNKICKNILLSNKSDTQECTFFKQKLSRRPTLNYNFTITIDNLKNQQHGKTILPLKIAAPFQSTGAQWTPTNPCVWCGVYPWPTTPLSNGGESGSGVLGQKKPNGSYPTTDVGPLPAQQPSL